MKTFNMKSFNMKTYNMKTYNMNTYTYGYVNIQTRKQTDMQIEMKTNSSENRRPYGKT